MLRLDQSLRHRAAQAGHWYDFFLAAGIESLNAARENGPLSQPLPFGRGEGFTGLLLGVLPPNLLWSSPSRRFGFGPLSIMLRHLSLGGRARLRLLFCLLLLALGLR